VKEVYVLRDLRFFQKCWKLKCSWTTFLLLNTKFPSGDLDGFPLNMAALRFNETFTSRYGGNTSEDINFKIWARL